MSGLWVRIVNQLVRFCGDTDRVDTAQDTWLCDGWSFNCELGGPSLLTAVGFSCLDVETG